VLALKAKLKVLTKQKNAAALAIAGRYFLHTGKVSKAKQCVEKVSFTQYEYLLYLSLVAIMSVGI
jgi:hypothetical protein